MTTPRGSVTIAGRCLDVSWVGPGPKEAPSIVMLQDDAGAIAAWGDLPEKLAAVTRCGVCSYASPPTGRPGSRAEQRGARDVVSGLLDAIGFERGILLGHGAGASLATIYAGGVADHRVRGLVLLSPRFSDEAGGGESAWDIRESIGYIRVPIQIVRGDGPGASGASHVKAAQDEAYCPVDVTTITGAGYAPHSDRPVETLAAVASFVEALLDAAGEAVGFPLRKASHGR